MNKNVNYIQIRTNKQTNHRLMSKKTFQLYNISRSILGSKYTYTLPSYLDDLRYIVEYSTI